MRSLSQLTLVLTVAMILPEMAGAQGIDPIVVDGAIQDARKSWLVPGVAVAIVAGDRVAYLKGFGVRERGTDKLVTPDTLFPLASCTKAFTTTAMAALVDDGRMQWDDPVRKHIDFFHLADPLADANVTLRDLVTHRTGLGSHDWLWYRAPWSQKEAIRRAGLLKPSHSFRATFEYQSTMFTAAGWAVASASGSSWQGFVQKRLLNPLEMTGTNFTTTTVLQADNHASPHRRDKDGAVTVIPWYPQEVPNPAGSLNSTARDLARWMQLQMSDGAFHGKRIVSAASLGETHMPQTIIRLEGMARAMNPFSTQLSYGMGWVIQDYRGQLMWSHAGMIDGFRCHITLLPNARIGLVILANLHGTRMNLALSNTLVDRLLGFPRKDWNAFWQELVEAEAAAAESARKDRQAQRQPEAKPSRPLDGYAGRYVSPSHGTIKVRAKDGSLNLEWNSYRATLEHLDHDSFVVVNEELGYPLAKFRLGEDDSVVAGIRVLGADFTKEK